MMFIVWASKCGFSKSIFQLLCFWIEFILLW